MNKASSKAVSRTLRLVRIAIFLALIIVGAFVKFPIGIVPVSMQFAFCMFASLMLGGTDSLICVAIYIAMGLIGIPVFASGGGFAYAVKPSFGFTLGFLVSCVVCGLIYKKSGNLLRTITAVLAGTISVYIIGIVYFLLLKAFYLGGAIDFWNVLLKFWIVFIPSDVLKGALCVIALQRIAKLHTPSVS